MKIGIVSPEFPPDRGGVQTYGVEFSRALARLGHDVTVFTSRHEGGELEGEPFRIETALQLRRRLDRRILHNGSFDAWHAMNAAYSWLALETARVCVTVHGNDFLSPYQPVARLDLRERWGLPFGSNTDRWLGEKLTHALVRRALPRVTHVFTNSHFTEQTFLRRYPACTGRTSAAMVGVAPGYFSKERPARAPGPTRLITVCRLEEPHKSVDVVLRALGRIRADFDFEYTIVGDGYLRPELEQLTAELELSDRVNFTGFVDGGQFHDLLLRSDLLVLTTAATAVAYEGFGLVYVEAAACGTPALAARIGGAVEAVREGTSGYFVDAVTVEQVEQRLRRFLAGKITFTSAACVEFARSFSWTRVAEHCVAVYSTML